MNLLAGLSAVCCVLFGFESFGQTVDAFNPGTAGSVKAILVQPDGQILLSGSFDAIGGQTHSYIGRVSANGTVDQEFNPQVTGTIPTVVGCMALQSDGKILLGGSFNKLCGQSRTDIGCITSDGSLDASFNPTVFGGLGYCVSSILVGADGKILVGGSFTSLAGQPRGCLGRLNSDGSLDANFTADLGGSFCAVSALVRQPDGKILVGGSFNKLGGLAHTNLARIGANDVVDSTFNPDFHYSSGSISDMALQSDGKVVIVGSFTYLGGQPRTGIGRLNSNGTVDTNFNPVVAGGDLCVNCVVVQPDGKIVVGGGFDHLAGHPCNSLGRLNPGGTYDTNFNAGVDNYVYCLVLQSNGEIVVGGPFAQLGNQARNGIGRLIPMEIQPSLKTSILPLGQAGLNWIGVSNGVYQLQYKTNLQDSWQVLGDKFTAANTNISVPALYDQRGRVLPRSLLSVIF